MRFPEVSVSSQNPVVLGKCIFNIGIEELTIAEVNVEEIKDFLLHRPLGILVLITCEYKNKYKFFCLSSFHLHYCSFSESLYEVVSHMKAWPHPLHCVRCYNFIPYDRAAELDELSGQIRSHLTSLLLESGVVVYSRGMKSFYEVSIV